MLFGLSKAASTDAGLILTVNDYLSTQLRSSHVFTYTLPRPQIQNESYLESVRIHVIPKYKPSVSHCTC